MNALNKQFSLFILIISSIIFFSSMEANYRSAEQNCVVFSGYQSHNRSNSQPRSHQDFSYTSSLSNAECPRSSGYGRPLSSYTTPDFKQHFTAGRYTEKEILDHRCLYMFDEFVKFAQTYSSYTCTIQELHATLKNLNWLQKAYYTAKGTYCIGLQKRILFLYNQLGTLKSAPAHNVAFVDRDSVEYKRCLELITKNSYSLSSFHQKLPTYTTLEPIYNNYAPSLSTAITKRAEASAGMSTAHAHYENKPYSLSNNVKQLLYNHGYNEARFAQCFGNALDQTLHSESLDILNRINCLPNTSILYDHQEALIDCTVAMVDYNHEGLTNKAMDIADFCWTLLDYGQAVAEGAALGVYSAAADILTNPIEATINIVAGKQVLAYQLSKVLYNVADIGVTAVSNWDHAKEKWDSYIQPINSIIDAINRKEITVRDVIKNGTALAVGWKAQSKLLGGLGKFCNTIKQKSINFVQNNSLLHGHDYLTTPEGLLLKATSKSNKIQPSGQLTTASHLKNTVENKGSKKKSLNKVELATKPSSTDNSTVNKGIISNVIENLRAAITRYQGHIFSKQHIKDDIMTLGKDQETIMDSLYNVIMTVDKKGLLKEGPNQIKATINGVHNVEIKCFIQKGKPISVDAYISDFNRIYNNFIDTTKI